jgi:DNA polymerase III subunit epsilon
VVNDLYLHRLGISYGAILVGTIHHMENLTFVSFDVETTGLSPTEDRIIQYGFSVFIRGTCVHTSSIDVCQDVPNKAFEINQISDERIANGISPVAALGLVLNMLPKLPRRWCIYNSNFDLGFVGAEAKRFGLEWDFRPLTIIDPLVVWRRFHPFKRGTLSYVAAYYGIPYNDEHDAGIDSAASGHVYCQMYSQHGELRNRYSNKMLEGWYNRWAGSFVEYATNKGLEIDLSSFQWPCRQEYICSDSSVQSVALPLW